MYTKGEVVWAKIKGFPWWPGVVAKVIEDKEDPPSIIEILVNFIGENSHAQLSLNKVAKFQQKYHEYAKMKKKKLLESIEIANKIIRGETTYEAESEKLENKEKLCQNLKKRRDGKSSEKSPSNDCDGSGMQCESDRTSVDDTDSISANENRGKQRIPQRKDSKRRDSISKTASSENFEKSPSLDSKNAQIRANGKREFEDHKDVQEPRLVKVLKMDDAIEDIPRPEPKRHEEQLSSRLESQLSTPPLVANNSCPPFNLDCSAKNIPVVNTRNSPKTFGAILSNNASPLPIEKEFDAVRELIIERIANHSSCSVSGNILEKSIENVISRINPETVSVSEIMDHNLGKNIYTVIVLLDELLNCGLKRGMSIESELSELKDKLARFNDIIKNRLILSFVENVDFCAPWLKKMEQKKEERFRVQQVQPQPQPQVEVHMQTITQTIQTEKEVQVQTQMEQEKPKEVVVQNINKLDKINQQITQEAEMDVKVEEEQPQPQPQPALEKPAMLTLQINFEEYRYDDKKKVLSDNNSKMVTTSTKINKPIYNPSIEAKKAEAKQKENVVNPNLRKKICLKMSKILQEKYKIEKDVAQSLTIKIETRIRNLNPDMTSEYKDKILVVLKLLKFAVVDIQEFEHDFTANFYILREKLAAHQKQHADLHLDAHFGEDSPSLAKEISCNSSMGSRVCEFK